jgi:AraC family transcriptional regulator of adaptative response/methylated-DNA-[protein]-cysteine methyltransferase
MTDTGMAAQMLLVTGWNTPANAQIALTDRQWEKVLARDAAADFVYAVETTGIVCRPSCPSRRPSRANVRFFATVDDALKAGFRPCLRCHPEAAHPETQKVQQLCAYLEKHSDRSATLRELSRLVSLSPFATQRLFQRVIGVSPRRYQMGLRAAAMRRQLIGRAGQTSTITDAIYGAGYSTGSRLYQKADQVLGMTPTRFRGGGKGEQIHACIVKCPGANSLGQLLIAHTGRGLCHVAFGDDPGALETELRLRFHQAEIHLGNSKELQETVAKVLSLLTEHPASLDLPCDLRATAFQARVWEALRAIPRGQTRSYHQVAEQIGQPSAARAVARACATNQIALVIPCHRVVGSDGELRGYRWGKERKRKLLEIESAETRHHEGRRP